MKKYILLLILFVVSTYFSYGQGTVRGKIADENGETLIGVTVVLKANKSIGTVTDFDGNYSLKLPDNTPQTLVISYVSYLPIEENVVAKNNEVIIKNFTMRTSAVEVKEIKITATAVKAKDYFMENIKKKSATTIDYISSETMKKTGDANVVNAVARVSGVSTNGGFITVRGIGDRYVKTAINGSIIPTLDPFTNNIKLDLFPSSLIDNILITKTASPEYPGDWAGAYISVETKDYPEQLAINVESTFGYNNNTSFKDVLSSERSSTDWLGYDKDLRDRNQDDFIPVNYSISQYEQMVGLGLGNYFNSIGVNASWDEGSDAGKNYFKLGLVQLGLLEPALFNDATAYTNAVAAYNAGPYQGQAYENINGAAIKSSQSFPNNWDVTKRQAPLNFSQSFSIGNQTTLFGKPLGAIVGFKLSNSIQYDETSLTGRASPDQTGLEGAPRITKQPISKENNGWSALINLAYKFTPNHSLGILFMPNFYGVNSVRDAREDQIDPEPIASVLTKGQFYEQRKQLVYQLKSDHYFPKSKVKVEFNASYTDGESKTPDFKSLVINQINSNGQYVAGSLAIGYGVSRFYRYLDENALDSRVSAEFPLADKPGLIRKLKFGSGYLRIDRKFSQYNYAVFQSEADADGASTAGFNIENNDINTFFNSQNFGLVESSFNGNPTKFAKLVYYKDQNPANRTIGYSDVKSAFVLTDYSINTRWRFEGGVRVEQARIFTDVVEYDSLGLGKNDPRRNFGGIIPNASNFDELSILPSANIIYKLKDNEDAPANIRFNFSQSVARPSIRELSETIVNDFDLRADVFGNSDLKIVNINNYDLRVEWYFKSNDHISVSGFYKDFKNHIELIATKQGFTWQNVNKAYVYGVEFEGSKKITKSLELRANVTLVKSLSKDFIKYAIQYNDGVKSLIPGDTASRPMFGQAPYVINGIVNYSLDSLGLGLTLSYNLQGPRLVLASTDEAADIYEMPRNLLDFKVTKTLGKHFGVNFTVRDILNSPWRRSYYRNNKAYLDWEIQTFGTNYVLGITYKI
jgi:hypothetical protein